MYDSIHTNIQDEIQMIPGHENKIWVLLTYALGNFLWKNEKVTSWFDSFFNFYKKFPKMNG